MKSIGKLLLKVLVGLVVIVGLFGIFVNLNFSKKVNAIHEKPEFAIHEDVLKANVELGKRIYMVRSGCVDCHGANLAGVMVMDNPAMGSIYGANITPFNLKNWSDEEIATAIRYGIHKDGRSLKFMPSFDYLGTSKSDIAALIAFIRSVPEVSDASHVNSFGPMAKILSVLGKMPVMFPAEVMDIKKGFGEKPEEAPTVEFGRYLAGSCVGCHGDNYVGGKIPGGDPSWPVASNIRLGADSFWDEAKFQSMILTGNSPRTGQALRPPMPIHLLKQMNEIEIKALWAFLGQLK